MTTLQAIPPRITHPPLIDDLTARLETRRRVKELQELAAAEGITLPMPAEWIATLEAFGYTVDLATGEWLSADEVSYSLTAQGLPPAAGGAL